jgi:hypothetical protein
MSDGDKLEPTLTVHDDVVLIDFGNHLSECMAEATVEATMLRCGDVTLTVTR